MPPARAAFPFCEGAGRTVTATMTPDKASGYDLNPYNNNGIQLASSI